MSTRMFRWACREFMREKKDLRQAYWNAQDIFTYLRKDSKKNYKRYMRILEVQEIEPEFYEKTF